MQRHTVFVLVYASDPVTATYISYEVASNLQPVARRTEKDENSGINDPTTGNWVVPEPAWTLADYATQCQNDPNVDGAFVIYDVENEAGSFNFGIMTNTYAHLYAKALFVGCEKFEAPYTSGHKTGIETLTESVALNQTPLTSRQDKAAHREECANSDCRRPSRVLDTPPPTSIQTTTTVQTQPGNVSLIPTPAPSATVQLQVNAPSPATLTKSESVTVIPTMNVEWMSVTELDSPHFAANQYGLPFLTVAAAGAYLASRTYTQSTAYTETENLVPNGSYSVTNSKNGNNSALPYGIAYIGSSLSSLSNLTFGGTNQSRVLKSSASGVASSLRRALDTECYSNTTWKNDIHRSFTGSAPSARAWDPTKAPSADRSVEYMCSLFTDDL